MRANNLAAARWIALLVPLALMAGALGSQYIGGLFPCEMCHWQRWPHYAAIVLAGLSFFVQRSFTRVSLIMGAGLLIAASGAIGVFHAGVEYGWWEGFTRCTSLVQGGGTPEEMLSAIMNAPLIRCDQPQWTLFGISLAGFNALVSIPAGIAVLVLATRKRA